MSRVSACRFRRTDDLVVATASRLSRAAVAAEANGSNDGASKANVPSQATQEVYILPCEGFNLLTVGLGNVG